MEARPVVVLTGATNGLGRIVALDLARLGVRLGIVARNPAKIDDLRSEISELAPKTSVDFFQADLSLMGEVSRAGKEIDSRFERVDVLINNAGVHAFSQRVTAEGVSEMTAVNYLAPWVLTNTLRDKLVASSPARIVTVASRASRNTGGIAPARDLVSTGEFSRSASPRQYGRTKLMDIMFSQELARQLADTGVTSNCCCPGFNTSGLGRELPFAGALEKILHGLRIGDPRRGAGIITRLAVDPEFVGVTGGYFAVEGAQPLECPDTGRGQNIQRELWDATQDLLHDILIDND